jgi:cellulose synthase/poly-beta-1,6-N-acetylglucosamine synthase-like glycosyltransferase
MPSLAPAPPPSPRETLAKWGKPFFVSSILTFLISSGLISWVKLLGAVSLTSAIGLVFATVALLLGSVFFLYSLKYYITLAIVLSFSQRESGPTSPEATRGKAIGLEPSLEHVTLKRYPKISVHIPLYNEKNVVERLIAAVTAFDYPGPPAGGYEIILADDSTDETTRIIRKYISSIGSKSRKGRKGIKTIKGEGWTLTQAEVRPGVVVKHLHRTSRSGFKGGALRGALRHTDPRAEFISVFDADFVPYPDTLELFLKYFKVQNNMSEDYKKSNVAVVQGYQWHVLNKSENWVTRGVRSEYAGSYVIERSGTEIYSGLIQISGAVYMIRRDVLEEVGWETSITEDFQLTLKLYEKGYKVVYTPYIQAPAECVSTLKRLIRQRMRWAEGHSNNVRKMFTRLLFGHWTDSNVVNDQFPISNFQSNTSLKIDQFKNSLKTENSKIENSPQKRFIPSPLTPSEKLEFLYLSPYYLQAFFFLVGTLSWLISETLFPARLPFWTSLWGWSLVLTNLISLPLMNAVGLFLEESEERDYQGIFSFIILTYIVVPFQAYAAVKGFLQKEEGPWFRTPKTGHITDVFARGRFYRFISGILPGRAQPAMRFAGSPYLALSTANSQFNSFNIKPRRKKWAGKVVLSLLLILSVTVYSSTKGVPEVLASNPSGTFNLDNTDSTLLSGTNWKLLDNTNGGDSTSTQITFTKGDGFGRRQYYPGSSNTTNEGGNCTSSSHDGNGWLFETPFESGGNIALGTWTIYFNESDDENRIGGNLDMCVWRASISGSALTSATLLFDTNGQTSWPLTDILNGGVNNTNYTVCNSGDSCRVQYNFSTDEYLYVEFYNDITAQGGPGGTTVTSTYRTGNTYSNPRIVTPTVTIPESALVFLLATPLIPYLVNLWLKKRRSLVYA